MMQVYYVNYWMILLNGSCFLLIIESRLESEGAVGGKRGRCIGQLWLHNDPVNIIRRHSSTKETYHILITVDACAFYKCIL